MTAALPLRDPAAGPPPSVGEYAPSTFSLLQTTLREGFLGMFVRAWRSGGDLTRMQLGSQQIFLVVHPEHVRHVTVTQRHAYEKVESYQPIRELMLGNGIITAVGEDWRRQRKLMASFFTPRGVEKYFPVFIADTQRFTQRWNALQGYGRFVDMFDEMMVLTASIILHTLFSTDSDDTVLAIKGAVERVITFGSRRQMGLFNLPLWLPTPEHLRFQRDRRRVDDYIQGVIAQRRTLPPEQWPEDLLTKLMTTRDEDTGALMSDQLLLDNGVSLFFAGHETTARTLALLWYALAEHPEVEARLHAELDAVLGEAPPTIADLKKLPYTLQVIKEVMRLYPAAPMYPRDAVEDGELGGMRIPKGSRVVLFPYGTHRHPDFWEEPERFDPDRWLPEREAARDPHAYHPFAAGQRICLGNNFSLFETHFITAMLARRFKVRLKPGHRPRFDMAGTLLVRNGMPMAVEAR